MHRKLSKNRFKHEITPLQAPSVVCYWDQLAKQCTAAAAQRMYTILAQEIIMLLSDMQMSH
jgi:hypothetical protein